MGRHKLPENEKAIRIQKYIPAYKVEMLGGKLEVERIIDKAIKDRLSKK